MTEKPVAGIEGTLHSVGGTGVVRMAGRYETDINDLWSALTDPQRLARWYGKVEGDLRSRRRVHGHRLRKRVGRPGPNRRVSSSPEVGSDHVGRRRRGIRRDGGAVADGDDTVLVIERRGISLDLLWAYGAGWHEHLEDLGSHVAGQETAGLAHQRGHQIRRARSVLS